MANNGVSWDTRLLFAPLNTLSVRSRTLVVALATLCTLAWSALHNGKLPDAWDLPDVHFYLAMARGRVDLVPAPFSARPLAPLLARGISALLHRSTETGFTVLAVLSLCFALAAVFTLAVRTRAPRCILILIAAVPFWPQLLANAGLPDALYTALLAGLLLALHAEALPAAALLMLPLVLTRESTWLTLLCLVAVGWRQLRWRYSLLALAATVAGTLIVRHFGAGSLPNPEHLPGSLYMAGKLVSNTFRSFGLDPWSNVYGELCGAPSWQHAVHLGPVRTVGICRWEPESLLETISALLTVFGILPAFALALLITKLPPEPLSLRGTSLLTRFCLLYGGTSFLLAPSLGTWYTRLFGYGWPLLLVALPRLVATPREATHPAPHPWPDAVWGTLVVGHLLIWAVGQTLFPAIWLLGIGGLEICCAALILVQRRPAAGALSAA